MSDSETLRRRIGFYRSCYLADSRELDLDNLAKLPEERWGWLDGEEELTSGALLSLPLPPALGAALDKQQNLYQRELQLVYGVLPICGRLVPADAPSLPVCGPLLYYEARLEAGADGESHFLHIDLQQPHANWRLLRRLLRTEQVTLDELPLPEGPIDTIALGELLAWVARSTVVEDIASAAAFPRLDSAEVLRAALRRKSLSLCTAACVALVARGSGSRGIAHELQLLQEAGRFSMPLRQLLGLPVEPLDVLPASTPESLPALLSGAQREALANAARYSLSQISGPPGTGKSYTLAALALDRYLNGESVLVVSRSEQAVKVIADKLRYDFGLEDVVLDGGDQGMLKTLRRHLEAWLLGRLGSNPLTMDERQRHRRNFDRHFGFGPKTPMEAAEEPLRQRLQQLVGEEQRLAETFRLRGDSALRWSALLLRAERRALRFWERWWVLPKVQRQVREAARPWVVLDELRQCQRERERGSRNYIQAWRRERLGYLVTTERQTLQKYGQALRARNSQRQLELFKDIPPEQLLVLFPIWVMTLDELHRLLPLHQELFDVLLMDEASQCDIASALPAFQRCRRAVVCGDAQQLRHLSFLSRQREERLLRRAGLAGDEREQWSYRDNSVLDLVGMQLASQDAVTFLDEHFRSRPALIRFSNEQFYDSRLKVMKERPGQTGCDSLQLLRVQGERQRNGVNEAEAEVVTTLLREHVQRYAESAFKPSIGVLSPFRDQVEHIRERIGASLSLEQMRQFRLLVATPYGFQGEERDLMIISFAVHGGGSQAGVYLNREDMFNVAITRARERQVLLFSGDERALPPGHLLRRYIERAKEVGQPQLAQDDLDAFEQELSTALQAHGVSTWVRYPLAGVLLDLFCQRGDKCLAIDLIGFPGEGEGFLELERYLVLSRAGLETLPLSYALWKLEPDVALHAILERL